MTDPTANTPCASEPDCPYCPDGHTPPTGGSQPWSAWVSADRDGDGQPTTINVARSAGAHVAESDAQWVRYRLNAPTAAEEQPTGQAASRHRYLSTGCLHGEQVLPDGRTGHQYCQSHHGRSGAKKPASCKFCGTQCVCPCHIDERDELIEQRDRITELETETAALQRDKEHTAKAAESRVDGTA